LNAKDNRKEEGDNMGVTEKMPFHCYVGKL